MGEYIVDAIEQLKGRGRGLICNQVNRVAGPEKEAWLQYLKGLFMEFAKYARECAAFGTAGKTPLPAVEIRCPSEVPSLGLDQGFTLSMLKFKERALDLIQSFDWSQDNLFEEPLLYLVGLADEWMCIENARWGWRVHAEKAEKKIIAATLEALDQIPGQPSEAMLGSISSLQRVLETLSTLATHKANEKQQYEAAGSYRLLRSKLEE